MTVNDHALIADVPAERSEEERQAERHQLAALLWWCSAAAAVIVPLVTWEVGIDVFRLPKMLALRLTGIILVTMGVVAAIWRVLPRITDRLDVRFAAVTLIWCVITSVTSSYPSVSLISTLTLVAALSVYIAVSLHPIRREWTFWLPLVPALINAVVYLLGYFRIWNPFVRGELALRTTDEELRLLAEAGLLGNRNDVGSYLVLPALLAIVLFFFSRHWSRYVALAVAVILTAGVFLSLTLTAIFSFTAGLLAIGFVRSPRLGLFGTSIAAAVLLLGLAFYAPLRERSGFVFDTFETGNYEEMLSARFTPFLAALEMTKDHPIVGVGPGRFAGRYFEYKLRVLDRRNVTADRVSQVSWSEVHNDFLQVLAETGIPGLLLLLGGIALILHHTLKRSGGSHLARAANLAVVASFLVLALAQFPMRVAATIVTYAFVAGVCRAWLD